MLEFIATSWSQAIRYTQAVQADARTRGVRVDVGPVTGRPIRVRVECGEDYAPVARFIAAEEGLSGA